jgi:hypothetical protein
MIQKTIDTINKYKLSSVSRYLLSALLDTLHVRCHHRWKAQLLDLLDRQHAQIAGGLHPGSKKSLDVGSHLVNRP